MLFEKQLDHLSLDRIFEYKDMQLIQDFQQNAQQSVKAKEQELLIPITEKAKNIFLKPFQLKDIVKKGQGAYFSSGSRPNQTGHSWGIARLASAVTGGKSAVVDYHILKKECKKTSKALKLANKAKRKYKTLRVMNKVKLK